MSLFDFVWLTSMSVWVIHMSMILVSGIGLPLLVGILMKWHSCLSRVINFEFTVTTADACNTLCWEMVMTDNDF